MPAKKEVEVYNADGTLYKKYDSLTEVVKDMGINLPALSLASKRKNPIFKINEIEYKVITLERKINELAGRTGTYKVGDTLLPGETEDECRRRLGLNPYGAWRNDEWMNAMFERVHKELYPDGYDEHAAWLAMRAKDRKDAGLAKPRDPDSNSPGYDSEENSYNNIDPEFLDYVK
jgi:hypothetical protein